MTRRLLLELDDPDRAAYLARRPTAPPPVPFHGHATFLARLDPDGHTDSDGTPAGASWCPLCDDDQEARAAVVLNHLRHGPLTSWQMATELGCRGRELRPLVASLRRRGLIEAVGIVEAVVPDHGPCALTVWGVRPTAAQGVRP